MIKKYYKIKPILAEQFDGSKDMCKKYGIEDSADSGYNDSNREDEGNCIPTREGYMRIDKGAWIATDPKDNSHWAIADDFFKENYRAKADSDMEELKSRLETMLSEDDLGLGEYSVGLKAALWELEHIKQPFVHDTWEEEKNE